jgi:hypothetical protein
MQINVSPIDVQRKAQAEIDAVVGNDRLPTFADSPDLPYVNAIVTEVLRWNSVGPTGKLNVCKRKMTKAHELFIQGSRIWPWRTVSFKGMIFPRERSLLQIFGEMVLFFCCRPDVDP